MRLSPVIPYHAIEFAGHEAWLHSGRAVYFPALRLLAAGDIHFEKGSFFGRFATFLPPYDTQDTLDNLEAMIAELQPRIFLALGDSFHDARAGERLCGQSFGRLAALIGRVPDWRWVVGNHDPHIHPDIPGARVDEAELSGIVFRHEAAPQETRPEISGHYHPKAAVTLRGHRITAPCFLKGYNRLILPSLGSFTGGLLADDPALSSLFSPYRPRIYLVHCGRVHALAD